MKIATDLTVVSSERLDSTLEASHADDEHLRVLRGIARALHGQSDPEQLLTTVCKTLKQFPGADLVSIVRVGDADKFDIVASDPDGPAERRTVSTTVLRDAVAGQQGLLVRETSKSLRYAKAKSVFEQDIRTIICVPISSSNLETKIIGVIYMDRRANQSKPFHTADLHLMILVADQIGYCFGSLEKISRLERVSETLRLEIDSRFTLVGQSRAIRSVVGAVEKVSAADSPVLLRGETGTGKEIIARMIHRKSNRRAAPFVPVNCAALAENLLESELFGHVKGAFTGAVADKPGRFELANGGTLFLDEIGEMKPELQAKLLRVIEDGRIERVGDTKARQVDVRLIAATNRDLKKDIESGRFRRDLYYRLNTVEIEIPPLRERPEDVSPLVEYFLGKFREEMGSKLEAASDGALSALAAYTYPGNVRELKNILERCVLFSSGSTLELADLPEMLQNATVNPAAPPGTLLYMERRQVLEALNQTGWSKAETAKILGISRPTLNKKIQDYELEKVTK